jgi:hypothetical protein
MKKMSDKRGGGPKTLEGKANSSRNALKHGATSNKVVLLQNESEDAWQQMLADCHEEFRPVTGFEHRIVQEIAYIKWRAMRAISIETSLLDAEMDTKSVELRDKFAHLDEPARQGHAFRSLNDGGTSFSAAGRYQTRLDRAYHRAVKGLEELRANRKRDFAKRTQA